MEIILFDKTYECTDVSNDIDSYKTYMLNIKDIKFIFNTCPKTKYNFSIWYSPNTFCMELIYDTGITISDKIDVSPYIFDAIIEVSLKYNLDLVNPDYAVLI